MRYPCRPRSPYCNPKGQKAGVNDHFSERWADFKIKHFAVRCPSINFAAQEVAPFERNGDEKGIQCESGTVPAAVSSAF